MRTGTFQAEILRLSQAGLGPAEIARSVKCHVQTVYYWTNPKQHEAVKRRKKLKHRLSQIGGPRISKVERDRILKAYLANPQEGTAMACHRGLPPLYAYKLANAMGLLKKHSPCRERSHSDE